MPRRPGPSTHPLDTGKPVHDASGHEVTGAARLHHLTAPATVSAELPHPKPKQNAAVEKKRKATATDALGGLFVAGLLAGGVALNFDVAHDQSQALGQAMADGSIRLAIPVVPGKFVPLEQLSAKQRARLDQHMKENGRQPIPVEVSDAAGKRICTGDIHPTQLKWALEYAAQVRDIVTVPANTLAQVTAPLCDNSSPARSITTSGAAVEPLTVTATVQRV
jgi:hypothetical protein